MLKSILALVLLTAAAVFGQDDSWNCGKEPGVTLTTKAYWDAQHPSVRALKDMQGTARGEKALELAKQGHKIDVPIHVWNWHPVCTMLVRKNNGFTWVPSALMEPVPVMPGIIFPGLPAYDPDHAPEGSIRVSVDANDYPAFDPPAVQPTPSSFPTVGQCYPGWAGETICGAGQNSHLLKDGDIVGQGGKNYRAYVSIGLMGRVVYFKPVAN